MKERPIWPEPCRSHIDERALDYGCIAGSWEPALVELEEPAGQESAVIVLPGGGFELLAMANEGREPAKALMDRGIWASILKYRVKQSPEDEEAVAMAHEECLRAVRLVRSWGRFKRIGLAGFSAGGYLALLSATQWGLGNPDAPDPIERHSSRPDFFGLVYPGVEGLIEGINDNTPPAFLVHAFDDFGPKATDTTSVFDALYRLKIPSEIHIFDRGSHGFGIGRPQSAPSPWIDLFAAWVGRQP